MVKEGLIGNLTCPNCGHVQAKEIPVDRCIHAYNCDGCKETIKAERGCCVFCDYGDRKCPVGH